MYSSGSMRWLDARKKTVRVGTSSGRQAMVLLYRCMEADRKIIITEKEKHQAANAQPLISAGTVRQQFLESAK
jgi:predicted O-methyltransferase YrrM